MPENSSIEDKFNLFESALKSIGLFIGTYGLAVFLVVYYAIKLYPELREERSEWIKQITAVRQIIDPETRPLTRVQADAVMDITINIYLSELKHAVDLFSRYYGEGGANSSENSVKIWDVEFEFNERSDENHLESILTRFFKILERQNKERRKLLAKAFDYSKNQSESSLYPLSRLKFGSHSLEEIWEEAESEMRKKWLTTTSDVSIADIDAYKIQAFIEFIGKHPAYQTDNDAINKLLEKLEGVGGNIRGDQIVALRNELETKISKALEKIHSNSKWLKEPYKSINVY